MTDFRESACARRQIERVLILGRVTWQPPVSLRLAPSSADGAYDRGWDKGNADGYAGNAYDAYDDTVGPEHEETYRFAYRDGFRDGQDAYRRTVGGS